MKQSQADEARSIMGALVDGGFRAVDSVPFIPCMDMPHEAWARCLVTDAFVVMRCLRTLGSDEVHTPAISVIDTSGHGAPWSH